MEPLLFLADLAGDGSDLIFAFQVCRRLFFLFHGICWLSYF